MQAGSPPVAAMHPMNPDHVHEELELMLPDFASYNQEWVARVPQWARPPPRPRPAPPLRVHADRPEDPPVVRSPRPVGAEVPAAPRTDGTAGRDVPRRDLRRDPSRPGGGHPVGGHHDGLCLAGRLPEHRPRVVPRLLGRSCRTTPVCIGPRPARCCHPIERPTCSSTSSRPTTSARSSGSTTSRGSG